MTTKPTTECPFSGDVGLLVCGRLTDERVPTVEAHLDGCPHCQLVIESAVVDNRLLEVLKEESATACEDHLPDAVVARLE